MLVTLDTTRADRIGCYGYAEGSTPHLDRLAGEGVLFEQAVSANPTTLPSHSTMFTGYYPQDHGVRYNLKFRLAPETVTLAERLRSAGFATAAVPASFILGRRYGLDQGFDTFFDPPMPAPGQPEPEGGMVTIRRRADEGVDLALDWIEAHRDRDFFLWLHFYDPHWPYEPQFPYSAHFRDRPYDGEIAYADAQLGRLVERLRASARWDETMLVVVGDHGEGLYDHDERFHSMLVYETTQRVPLIVRAPGLRPGRVAEPVGLIDLVPTVLDLVGLEPMRGVRGISLRPALTGGELPRRELYFESLTGSLSYGWSELRGIRSGHFKLIDSHEPELYDLQQDPGETANLAGREPELLQEMRAALEQLTEPLGDAPSAARADDAVLDAETEALLAGLGYVGGTTSGTSPAGAPHPREVIDLEAELLHASVRVAREEWPEVEAFCRGVLQRDPTNKAVLEWLARALVALGRPGEAQDHAAELLRLYPDNEVSYRTLAETYRAQAAHDEAWAVLHQGVRALPESRTLAYLMLVAGFDAGREELCEDEVAPAVERFPESWRFAVLQARCEARRSDFDAALEMLESAVRLGFDQVGRLEETPDFRRLAELPGFRALVAAERSGAESKGGG